MNTQEHSTASAQNPEPPAVDLGDVIDLINRSDYMVELINMAAEAGAIGGDAGNAIAWGCVHIRELLDQAGQNVKVIQRWERGTSAVHVAAIDPLLKAVRDYESALADYNANSPSGNEKANAYADETYAPAMRILQNWSKPALSRAGALAALRVACKEAQDFQTTEMIPSMLDAALGYFEQEGGEA